MFYKSRPVSQLNPYLLPAAYDSWGAPTEKYIEEASTVRPVYIMPWNAHVVSEGYVPPDDRNLQRAIRGE